MVLRDIDLPTALDVAERGMATIRYQEILHGDSDEPIRRRSSSAMRLTMPPPL